MKQNDIAALVLIVVFAGVLSYFAASKIIGVPSNNPVSIERPVEIESSFAAPDKRVFNDKSIDPTVEITGGDTSDDAPFSRD